MSAKELYREYLAWLKAKHKEIVAVYWNEPAEAQGVYRKLLLKIQAEAWATERILRNLNA